MAIVDFELKGVDKFMKNLNDEIRALEGRTLEGLIQAVIEVQRAADPMTPLRYGNLRASWFTVSVRGEEDTQIGVVEFTGPDAAAARADDNRVKQAARAAVQKLNKRNQPVVLFGYSANYAVFVHENIDANFKRPGAKARWLYLALQQARSRMLDQIQKHAKF